ncbi:hypothetical protein [Nitrosopumilus sp.]|uniref:hypothetical protein n=1 Tax=Nitrosopumilus sp. TaxID=2024843 RepID=UPI003D0E92D0
MPYDEICYQNIEEFVPENHEPGTPIIVEHHGIKEFMSLEEAQKVRFGQNDEGLCDDCKHYSCVCWRAEDRWN